MNWIVLSFNLLSQISDHFPQFLIIKNVTVDYRNCSLFQYEYSKCNEESFINDFKELLWEDINDVNKNDKNLLCYCLYRHPSSDINKFIDHMTSILQKVLKENKTLFFMSDFNINLYNYSSHTETNDFIN